MRLVDFFIRSAVEHGDNTCLCQGPTKLSYSEVLQSSQQIAVGISALDLSSSAKAAILSPNSIEAYFAVLGLQQAGCVWVSLNYRAPVEALIEQINLADVELLFCSIGFDDQLAHIRERCPKLAHVVALTEADNATTSLGELFSNKQTSVPEVSYSMTEMGRISFTGGTSGNPKAAMIPHMAQVAFTETLVAALKPKPSSRHLLVAPLSHAAGSASFAHFAVGATVIILNSTDPRDICEALEAERITDVFLPPTLISMLMDELEQNPRVFPNLCNLIYGAAPMAPDQIERAMAVFGPVLMQIYAQSEAPMAVSHMLPKDHIEALQSSETKGRLASAGRVCIGTRVRLISRDGSEAAIGEPGEIQVKGAINMLGYYNDAEATTEAIEDGWLKTGDIGRIDQDGFLYVVDRLKDMIITGGFNVYPSQIEAVLSEHPHVAECAVIGIPDRKWGEKVTAVVVLRRGHSLSSDELHAFCRQKLGGILTPKDFLLRDSLPKSHLGKVLKRVLKSQLLETCNTVDN